MAQPVQAIIYANKKSHATEEVANFIADNLEFINRVVKVKFVYVTPETKDQIIKMGIKSTPTMRLGNQFYVGTDEIKRALTPIRKRTEDVGSAVDNPEELVAREMAREMANKSEQETDDVAIRGDEIRQKMAAMQSRRPVMVGLRPGDKPIPGGKPIRKSKGEAPTYNDDEAFIKASRQDNIMSTPISPAYSDLDGQAALEEYRNMEADKMRDNRRNKPWRRPTVNEA